MLRTTCWFICLSECIVPHICVFQIKFLGFVSFNRTIVLWTGVFAFSLSVSSAALNFWSVWTNQRLRWKRGPLRTMKNIFLPSKLKKSSKICTKRRPFFGDSFKSQFNFAFYEQKWADPSLFLFIFVLFHRNSKINWNSVEAVLGVRTLGHRMVGAGWSTELWQVFLFFSDLICCLNDFVPNVRDFWWLFLLFKCFALSFH